MINVASTTLGPASAQSKPGITKKSVTVSDGVSLSYLEAGSGPPLVLIPGWSQTAEQFRYQLEGLADRYRVIAIDMRGHGDSEKPTYGYHIQRLSKDVSDVLTALNLQDVAILGHSMGCSVLWGYFDLFGPARIGKYIFCDQAACLTSNPMWSAEEFENSGAIFTAETVLSTYNALRGPDGVAASKGFVTTMATTSIPAEQLQWIIDVGLKMPRTLAATLLYNHCHQDWRDVLPRIRTPSLFIGGKSSLVPWKCMAWEASQVPGSKLDVLSEEEKGSHFMFIENPQRFNAAVASFVG